MKKALTKEQIKMIRRWIKALKKGETPKFKSYEERFMFVLLSMK